MKKQSIYFKTFMDYYSSKNKKKFIILIKNLFIKYLLNKFNLNKIII